MEMCWMGCHSCSEGGFVGGLRGKLKAWGSVTRRTKQARIILEHPTEVGRGRLSIFRGPGAA